MDLLEYQANHFLKSKGIPLLRHGLASSVQQIEEIVDLLNLTKAFVKPQSYIFEDEKKRAESKWEIIDIASSMLHGKFRKVIISEILDTKLSYPFSFYINKEGILKMDFYSDDEVFSIPFELNGDIYDFHLASLKRCLKWNFSSKGCDLIRSLAKIFAKEDGSFLEGQIQISSGQFYLSDVKLSLDENALFRHEDIARSFDVLDIPSRFLRSWHFDLQLLSLDGNIGSLVKGKDSVFSTLDMIQICNKKPGDIVNISTGITKDILGSALLILTSNPKIKTIFINIFAPDLNCEVLADAVSVIMEKFKIKIPVFIRLEGHFKRQAYKIIESLSLKNIFLCNNLPDVMKKLMAMRCSHRI